MAKEKTKFHINNNRKQQECNNIKNNKSLELLKDIFLYKDKQLPIIIASHMHVFHD